MSVRTVWMQSCLFLSLLSINLNQFQRNSNPINKATNPIDIGIFTHFLHSYVTICAFSHLIAYLIKDFVLSHEQFFCPYQIQYIIQALRSQTSLTQCGFKTSSIWKHSSSRREDVHGNLCNTHGYIHTTSSRLVPLWMSLSFFPLWSILSIMKGFLNKVIGKNSRAL